MATWYYDRLVNELNVNPTEAALRAGEMTRDKNRTPMQWSNKPNGGFSPDDVETWLPVNPNYKNGINVKDQQQNPDSLLNYYKHLLHVRKNTSALVEGDYLPLHNDADEYFAFIRNTDEQTVLVVLNYSEKHLDLDFSINEQLAGNSLQLVFSSATRSKMELDSSKLHISAFEVFVAKVK
jgi:alpha-glucosidase